MTSACARDLQKSDGQWSRAKGFDTFLPAGPIVSTDINPLETPVTLTTRLNGAVKQQGSTASLIFNIPHLLRYITAFTTLEPRKPHLPTGTPAGVGPPRPAIASQVEVDGPLAPLQTPSQRRIPPQIHKLTPPVCIPAFTGLS